MLLTASNIRKKIGEKEILKGVDLKLKKGDVISIIGPSGSGKTTFLRMLVGLDEFSSGEIVYKNNKNRKGMIFQNFNLFPHKTALENVVESLVTVDKLKRELANIKGMEYLKKVGLEGKENQMPKTLSGGEKQRVAIARALVREPEILFLDEPTSALDPEMSKEVLNEIKKLKNGDMTMVIVSHEMKFVREISDKIIFMENGRVSQEIVASCDYNVLPDRIKDYILD